MFPDFYDSPLCFTHTVRATALLRKRYPFLKCCVMGHSLLERPLYAFTLGQRQDAVLYVGAVHGMEWLTGLLLFRFLEDLCAALAQNALLGSVDVARALERRSLTVIPVLNPDGVEIAIHGAAAGEVYRNIVMESCPCEEGPCSWQANARGIDLNHNFDAGFEILQKMEREKGYHKPGPTRYGGTQPHSEPETAALVDYCLRYTPPLAMAFHSQGEEIYYDYPPYTPRESPLYARILGKLSGYQVCRPTGLASHGGFKDWFLKAFGRPAFTWEIGRGKNPLPIAELQPIYSRLLEAMLAGLLL